MAPSTRSATTPPSARSPTRYLASPRIWYAAHVENEGWNAPVRDGEVAGTVGKGPG